MPLNVLSTQSIAIAAGKGGVGKSTFTILLAGALKRLGHRVGILDADLYGPSLRHLLPEQRQPQQQDGKLIPAMAQGVQTLSLAFFQEDIVMRAPIANQLVKQFLQKVAWKEVSQLLIDFPPGTGDIPITVAQAAALSGAVIVTTPQPVAVLDVRKTVKMFQKMGVPILGIVENMSGAIFGQGGGVALSEEFGVPFLGSIPLDGAICKAADQGSLLDLKCADPMAGRLIHRDREPLPPVSILEGEVKLSEGVLHGARIQKACPCAQCRGGNVVEQDVVITGFEHVGHYGLRFDFSSGCSYGIYEYVLLKRLLCEN